MKCLVLVTSFVIVSSVNFIYCQSQCNLINSITLSVPQDKKVGAVTYASDAPGNWNFWNDCEIQTNNWIYVAYTKDQSNNLKLYFNGQLVKTSVYQNLPFSWNSLRLGIDLYTNPNSAFKGKIDELRISNVVRTATEINQYYNSNQSFVSDINTLGLYKFDQNSGNNILSSFGPNGVGVNTQFSSGYYGNSVEFNGVDSRVDIPLNIPEDILSVEFWLYVDTINGNADWVINYPGLYSAGFEIGSLIQNYTWSTGSNGTSVTVDPTIDQYVWVTDGNCTDTVWFDSPSFTVYDTTFVSVTDTLIINTTTSLTPNNLNTIKIYPNPAKTHITIDYGDYSILNGHMVLITNTLGQVMFSTVINQQTSYIDLSNWSGNGLYYVQIFNDQNSLIHNKKIMIN